MNILFAALHMVRLLAHSVGGQGVELRQLLGEQRKCMAARPQPPSTRMT